MGTTLAPPPPPLPNTAAKLYTLITGITTAAPSPKRRAKCAIVARYTLHVNRRVLIVVTGVVVALRPMQDQSSRHSPAKSPSGLQAFAFECLCRLPPPQRVALLRITDAEWAAALRWMDARSRSAGPGLFYQQTDAVVAAGPSRGRRRAASARRNAQSLCSPAAAVLLAGGPADASSSSTAGPSSAPLAMQFATRHSHPSLGVAPLVPRVPESAGEARRRAADALVRSCLRLAEASNETECVLVSTDQLGSAAAVRQLWVALLALSGGQFACAPSPPAALTQPTARASWFQAAGWFTLGTWVASRLDIALTT
eukprot:scaffold1071_cov113-Isochrysis_galbana.AAC.7